MPRSKALKTRNAAPVPDPARVLRGIKRSFAHLINALEGMMHGQQRPAAERPPGIDRLTDREREVIIHVCDPDQRTYEVIAGDLHMHRGTLQVHIASIFEKLEVGNRGGLIRVAVLNGLDREE
jgi:DNA-binding CsgD family transcriptional regulator